MICTPHVIGTLRVVGVLETCNSQPFGFVTLENAVKRCLGDPGNPNFFIVDIGQGTCWEGACKILERLHGGI